MGMADEARELNRQATDAERRHQDELARIAARIEDWRSWVQDCVPEFLTAAREVGLRPDSAGLFGKRWVVEIPTSDGTWPGEPAARWPGQDVAVESNGSWLPRHQHAHRKPKQTDNPAPSVGLVELFAAR
jgi:hypothetical protein